MQQAESYVDMMQGPMNDDVHLEEIRPLMEFDAGVPMTIDDIRQKFENSRQHSAVNDYVTLNRWFSGVIGGAFFQTLCGIVTWGL